MGDYKGRPYETMTIRIIQVTLEHLDSAFDLLRRFFVEEGFTTALEMMRPALRMMLADPDIAVFLAWQGKAAIGVATVTSRPSIEHGVYAEIEDLYVIPEARGAGIATALIDAAVQWCRARKCSSVEVCITPKGEAAHGLTRFYEKFGFADTGRKLISKPL